MTEKNIRTSDAKRRGSLKKRKKTHRGQKWVGGDKRVSQDISLPCEIFFAVFKPFFIKTTFYTKYLTWFSGSKTEVT